jgi:hypothetical protein
MTRLERRNRAFAITYTNEIDYPFRYHERGLYAIFSASIASMTNIYLSELPVMRHSTVGDDLNSGNGRADFWCHYRNNDIVIELKRVPIGLRNAGAAGMNRIQAAWDSLGIQADNALSGLCEWADGYQLGLLTIIPYSLDHSIMEQSVRDLYSSFSRTILDLLGSDCKFIVKINIPKTHRRIFIEDIVTAQPRSLGEQAR